MNILEAKILDSQLRFGQIYDLINSVIRYVHSKYKHTRFILFMNILEAKILDSQLMFGQIYDLINSVFRYVHSKYKHKHFILLNVHTVS